MQQLRNDNSQDGTESRAGGEGGEGGGSSRWDEVFWSTNHMHLRVRAIHIQCGSKQPKTKLYLREPLCVCDAVTHLFAADTPAEQR